MDCVEGTHAQQDTENAGLSDDIDNFQAISHDKKEKPVKNIKLGKSVKVLCDEGSSLLDVSIDENACLPGAGGIGTSNGNDDELGPSSKFSRTEKAKALKAGSG